MGGSCTQIVECIGSGQPFEECLGNSFLIIFNIKMDSFGNPESPYNPKNIADKAQDTESTENSSL